MSVLIMGFEMPTARDTLVLVRKDGTAIVYEDEAYVTTAVPVPPHGRLIDGGVAEGIYFTEEDENGKDFCDGILYAADWISKQPTIIPPSGGKEDE